MAMEMNWPNWPDFGGGGYTNWGPYGPSSGGNWWDGFDPSMGGSGSPVASGGSYRQPRYPSGGQSTSGQQPTRNSPSTIPIGSSSGGGYSGWPPQMPNIPFDTGNLSGMTNSLWGAGMSTVPWPLAQQQYNQYMGGTPQQNALFQNSANYTYGTGGSQGLGADPMSQWYQSMLGGISGQIPGMNNLFGQTMGNQGTALNYLMNNGEYGRSDMQNLLGSLSGSLGQNLGTQNTMMQYLAANGLPGRGTVEDMMGGFAGGYNQISNPYMSGLEYILNSGEPNRQEIQGRVGGYGQSADQMQNYLNQAYGGLSQTGLPGQATFQDLLLPGQQGTFQALQGANIDTVNNLLSGGGAPGVQGTTFDAINSALQGGGVSPEWIEAMRNQIYEPSQRELLGSLNEMGGGYGALNSGLPAEYQRLNLRDFNDSMARMAMENRNTTIGQGLQAGNQGYGQQLAGAQLQNQQAQQAFGNAMDMFRGVSQEGRGLLSDMGNYGQTQTGNMFAGYQAIPNTMLPYMDLARQTGQDQYGNLLAGRQSINSEQWIPQLLDQQNQWQTGALGNTYGQMAGTGLDIMGMNQNFGMGLGGLTNQAYGTMGGYGDSLANWMQGGRNTMANMYPYMGNYGQQDQQQAMQFQQMMQQLGLSNNQQLVDLLGAGLSGEYQRRAAGSQATGNITAAAFQAIPAILGLLGIGRK